MRDRGMKKWMAYKSLTEQAKYMGNMERERAYVERPLISSSQAEEINEVLVHYRGEAVTVRFYQNGAIRELDGTIDKIDAVYRVIQMKGLTIPFPDLLGLEVI